MVARRALYLVVAAVLATSWAVGIEAQRVSAATLTASPDPTTDGGPGSLRAAVAAANNAGGDEIDLQSGGTYTLTCAGGGQLSHPLTPLTITTPSGSPATIRQTCPGSRVLAQSLGTLTIHNVVITGGNYTPAAAIVPVGGGIEENFGSVVVSDSTFENNSVTAAAGEPAPVTGGAIGQTGFLLTGSSSITVTNSTFTNNAVTASSDPGCLSTPGSCGDAFGGAIGADVPVTVNSSTFKGNTATDPHPGPANFAVGAHGGAIDSSSSGPSHGGPVVVTNSSFTGNSVTAPAAYAYGGAISSDGGPASTTLMSSVFTHNSVTGQVVAAGGAVGMPDCCGGTGTTAPPVAVTSSTFADNTATATGGVGWGGAIGVPVAGGIPPSTATNSTITGNTASTAGGGVVVSRFSATYSTVVDNTASTGANLNLLGSLVGDTGLTSFGSVFAFPHGGGSNCFLATHPTVSAYSYSDDSSCNLAGSGDRESASDPMLAVLADNGGPAPTRLPLPGSPLLDAIPAGSCQADGAAGITTDERGLPRPDPGAPTCDIGAVEIQLPSPPSPLLMTARFTG